MWPVCYEQPSSIQEGFTYVYRCLHARWHTSAFKHSIDLTNLASATSWCLSNCCSCLFRNFELLLDRVAALHWYRERSVCEVVLHCEIHSPLINVCDYDCASTGDLCHCGDQQTDSACAEDQYCGASLQLCPLRSLNGYTQRLQKRTQIKRHILRQPATVSTIHSQLATSAHLWHHAAGWLILSCSVPCA